MLASLLIGLVAGSRSLAPVAVVGEALRRHELPAAANPARSLLANPVVAAGTKLLAAGELWGDKLKAAPDRIVPAGILARVVTGALAGAALAPRRQALAGAVVGASAAVLSAYVTFELRMRAMRRFGQTPTGLVEDALTLGAAQMVVKGASRARA